MDAPALPPPAPPDDPFRLFPFERFVDGEPSPTLVARLDGELAKVRCFAAADLAAGLTRVCGAQPREFYRGAAAILDSVLVMFRDEIRGAAPDLALVKQKGRTLYLLMATLWAAAEARASAFAEIK